MSKEEINNKEFWGMVSKPLDFNGMKFSFLGSSGLKVPIVGLGTWKIGYPELGDGSRVNEKTAMEIFDKSLELGVTFWDTANRYNESSGNSERVIGDWLKKNPAERRNIIIATKVFGLMDGKSPNHWGLSRQNILEAVYACLRRLKLDHIDLLQFHNFDETVEIKESLEAIDYLIKADKIRYFGVSNFNVEQLKEYLQIAEKYNLPRIQSVQNQFNPLDGEKPEQKGVLEFCKKEKITFIAFSPLKKGVLTEKYLQIPKKGDRLVDEGVYEKFVDEKVKLKLEILKKIADKEKVTISQLSLAYLIHKGILPIPSASSVRQLEENTKAALIPLKEETIKELKEIFV